MMLYHTWEIKMAERKNKGDTFHNQWQSFRVKKNPKEDYEAKHKYVRISNNG